MGNTMGVDRHYFGHSSFLSRHSASNSPLKQIHRRPDTMSSNLDFLSLPASRRCHAGTDTSVVSIMESFIEGDSPTNLILQQQIEQQARHFTKTPEELLLRMLSIKSVMSTSSRTTGFAYHILTGTTWSRTRRDGDRRQQARTSVATSGLGSVRGGRRQQLRRGSDA